MTEQLLANWYIRYDEETKMPDFVSGILVNPGEDVSEAKLIKDIIYMDQHNNLITTDDGEIYRLLGSGTRILYVDESIARDYERQALEEFYQE
jgi:hypothetical protein